MTWFNEVDFWGRFAENGSTEEALEIREIKQQIEHLYIELAQAEGHNQQSRIQILKYLTIKKKTVLQHLGIPCHWGLDK